MYLTPDQVEALPREIVGGKAWGLAKLAAIARVPNFRVIVPDESLKSDLETLATEFTRSTHVYAVRSSAAAEDSANASFAGLFVTVLGATASEIPESVGRVIDSANASRVKQFQDAVGIDQTEVPKMAVIVQEIVEAIASGVALSFAPNTERRQALIEAIFGLGEPLVGGKIPPDSWSVDRKSRAVTQYRPAHQIWKQTSKGRIVVQSYERNVPKLDVQQVDAVTELLFSVEEKLRFPATDLEFCFDTDALYALQARPLLSH